MFDEEEVWLFCGSTSTTTTTSSLSVMACHTSRWQLGIDCRGTLPSRLGALGTRRFPRCSQRSLLFLGAELGVLREVVDAPATLDGLPHRVSLTGRNRDEGGDGERALPRRRELLGDELVAHEPSRALREAEAEQMQPECGVVLPPRVADLWMVLEVCANTRRHTDSPSVAR